MCDRYYINYYTKRLKPCEAVPLEPVEDENINLDTLPSQIPSGRKRKAEHELSTNPHTVKARKRNEAIQKDPITLQIEKAKAADQGAITYAKKKLVNTEEFQNASVDEQATMIKSSAAEVIVKRYVINSNYTNPCTNL